MSEDEKVHLMEFQEVSRTISATRGSEKRNCTIVLLALSNTISVLIVLVLALSNGFNTLRCDAPATVIYPSQPSWFPPQSSLHVTRLYHINNLHVE